MNKSGFTIKASQSLRVLINVRKPLNQKVIYDRQKWITAIKYINIIGAAIPPLIIFKIKYINIVWIPINTPVNQRFSTNNSSWTLLRPTSHKGCEVRSSLYSDECRTESWQLANT